MPAARCYFAWGCFRSFGSAREIGLLADDRARRASLRWRAARDSENALDAEVAAIAVGVIDPTSSRGEREMAPDRKKPLNFLNFGISEAIRGCPALHFPGRMSRLSVVRL